MAEEVKMTSGSFELSSCRDSDQGESKMLHGNFLTKSNSVIVWKNNWKGLSRPASITGIGRVYERDGMSVALFCVADFLFF